MLRSEAIARIKRGLDFRTTGDAAIADQLQESQRQLEKGRSLPRFLIEEDESFVVTSGSADVALPTGFLREVDGEGFRYYDSSEARWTFLEKMTDYNEAQARFANSTSSRPRAYVLRKNAISFFPARDTSYTYTWSYYKAADVLSSDIENAWLEHNPEALIGHAGMVYASDLNNTNAVQRFTRMFSEAWSGQFAEDIERLRDNDPMEMGGRL